MARSGAAQSAEVIGLMNVISQSGQRERELKQERSFEGMLNQWNQLATAQRRKEEIELTNTMETMRQADIRKDQLKDKISNYGIMLEQSGGEAAASPGFMSVMKDSVGKAEQQYGTLEEQGQQHQAKIAQTMQRIDAINKQSDQANTMNTQFQQGYGDVSTAQWIIQKYGGTAGEGTLDKMRVNQDELRSALEGLPQNKKDVYAPGSASFMGLQKQLAELQSSQIKESQEQGKVGAMQMQARTARDRLKQDKVLRPGEILAIADDRFPMDMTDDVGMPIGYSPGQKEKRFAFIKKQFKNAKMGDSGWDLSELYDFAVENEEVLAPPSGSSGPGLFSEGGYFDKALNEKAIAKTKPQNWRNLPRDKKTVGHGADWYKKNQPERLAKAKEFIGNLGIDSKRQEPTDRNAVLLLSRRGADRLLGERATAPVQYSPNLIKKAQEDLKANSKRNTKEDAKAFISLNPEIYGK